MPYDDAIVCKFNKPLCKHRRFNSHVVSRTISSRKRPLASNARSGQTRRATRDRRNLPPTSPRAAVSVFNNRSSARGIFCAHTEPGTRLALVNIGLWFLDMPRAWVSPHCGETSTRQPYAKPVCRNREWIHGCEISITVGYIRSYDVALHALAAFGGSAELQPFR